MHTSIQLVVKTAPVRLQRNTAPTLIAQVKGGPAGPPGSSPLTTVGDLLGFNGADDRFPVGADDTILIADSGEAFGFRWGPQPATSPLTTKGDLYAFDSDNARLPVGTPGQFLRANPTPGIGLEWDTFDVLDIPAHASTHENGGSDEMSVTGLSGLLADGQTPLAHASTHEFGGSDPVKTERQILFQVENPVTGDDLPRYRLRRAFRVLEIVALKIQGAGSFDWELRYSPNANDQGAGTLLESDTTVTNETTGLVYTPPFDPGDPAVIPAGNWIWLELPAVSTGLARPVGVAVMMNGRDE